jgi:hypothetical protein
MTDAETIADVLGQVVDVGSPAAEANLGAAVSQHVAARRPTAPPAGDVEAALQARARQVLLRPNLGLATTAELLDELRARIDVAGLLDYTTVGGTR